MLKTLYRRAFSHRLAAFWLRFISLIPFVLACLILWQMPVSAQSINFDFGEGPGVSERALQLIALITVLSLAPSILIMVTSFTRIVVVLSILRTAIGAQTTPPNIVIISLSLFLTGFIMAPTFEESYRTAIVPLTAGEMDLNEAFSVGAKPFRTFMLRNLREDDLKLFLEMSETPVVENEDDISLSVIIPAFMISELRRAFEIGFLLYLPFVVVDLLVSSVLMSMGMMMLPPVVISLPFKLIFFVLVDGWNLIAGSLVRSFV